MSLMDKLKGEFVDIIEWNDDSPDTLVWRFPRYQDEIKQGAQLTVRPSQVAVFVNEGKVADVFEPGMHRLETRNLPILSTLRGWKFGFDSPFKADVFFVSARQFTDLKWGTKNPVVTRDADFGMVRLRAFGSFVIKAKDARKLVEQVAGTSTTFTVEEIREQLRNTITTRFADMVSAAKIPLLDLASHYDNLSAQLAQIIQPDFAKFGLETTQVLIENISVPEEVEKSLDKRSSMGAVGNLDQFAKFQAANAMEAAAKNPGGAAGSGLGLGVGIGLAGAMGGLAQASASTTASVPPPLPSKEWWVAIAGKQHGPHDLSELAELISQGALSKDSLAWKQGLSGWLPMANIPELNSLLASTPPPLPR